MKQEQKRNAAKIVSASVLGLDYRTVVISGKRYIIHPPTIKKLCGAAMHLSDVADAQTIADIIASQDNLSASVAALSWLIVGDESLVETLADATPDEVSEALQTAYSLVSVDPFLKLSLLARNAATAIAKPKQ